MCLEVLAKGLWSVAVRGWYGACVLVRLRHVTEVCFPGIWAMAGN